MTITRLFFLVFLVSTQANAQAQPARKVLLFAHCDSLKDSKHTDVLNTDIKSSDEEISNWLIYHANGKKLNGGAEFTFVLDKTKGVCCKRIILYDSTNKYSGDVVALIKIVTGYPEFQELAKNASHSKLLNGVVFFDRKKKKYGIGLMPVFEH